jgi:hypothetical protein
MKTNLKVLQWGIRVVILFVLLSCLCIVPLLLFIGVKIGAAGLYLAAGSILLTAVIAISKQVDDHVIGSFESAMQLLDTIKNILLPIQNDRIQWVYAARTVLQYKILKEQVTISAKLTHLQIHEIETKYEIAQEFRKAGKNGLEASFFYGANDWSDETNLNNAARRSSENSTIAFSVNPNKNQQAPSLLEIPGKAVVAVYDFLEFDELDIDLLDKVEVWEEDRTADFPNFKQGAHKYIIHARDHRSVGGSLMERNKDTEEWIVVPKN